MQFSYTRYQARPTVADPNRTVVDLPHIPITLIAASGRQVDVLALVDSGADISYFGPHHAQFLELDIKSGAVDQCTGIGGTTDCYYHDNIEIEVGGHRIQISANFAESWAHDFALLGRKDFFERFKVVFDESKKTIDLTFHVPVLGKATKKIANAQP